MVKLLQWCIRLAGMAALILGLLIGRVSFDGLLRAHMMLGYVVVGALGLIAVAGFFARLPWMLPGIALVWVGCTVYVAIAQGRLVTGDAHWVIEVLHAALGIGTIGLAEAIGARMSRRQAA